MKLDRITFDPAVMQGKACIRGMRITVGLILNLIANGMSHGEIIRNYPDLEEEDIKQSLGYAALMVEDRVSPVENAHAVSG